MDYEVSLSKIIEKMNLENCTPELDISDMVVTQTDVNRPALQLTGFFEFFDSDRIQVIGKVEALYMEKAGDEGPEMMKRLFEYHVPCVVYCRSIEIPQKVVDYAMEYKVPLLRSAKSTSSFMAEIIRWLHVELAPRITIHGVLMDIYGEGVLITGESGIGKSEAALELIKRGHRLVTDDAVEIRKVSDDTLVGTAPDLTRHFIELRGIGIIDVKSLFGVGSVRNSKQISMVIHLTEFNKDADYDRLGLEEQYVEYLGHKVVCHNIPIRPGRNLAIICESAAINHRQKNMGYNAAEELYNRVANNLKLGGKE